MKICHHSAEEIIFFVNYAPIARALRRFLELISLYFFDHPSSIRDASTNDLVALRRRVGVFFINFAPIAWGLRRLLEVVGLYFDSFKSSSAPRGSNEDLQPLSRRNHIFRTLCAYCEGATTIPRAHFPLFFLSS